jgi:hypothetical protein
MARFPVTTHQWLKPLYTTLNSPTGIPAFYGMTGAKQVATGGNGVIAATNLSVSGIAATGLGASGFFYALAAAGFNGGSGNVYTLNDVVVALKNIGILKP